MLKLLLIPVILLFSTYLKAQNRINPSIENVISLSNVSNAKISPDGISIAFIKQSTNWKTNKTDNHLWISKNKKQLIQITNHKAGNIYSPKWSSDSNWIAYLSDKNGSNQIYAIDIHKNHIIQITNTSKNIVSFEWAPNNDKIAFIQSGGKLKNNVLKDKTGDYTIIDHDYQVNQLWITDFVPNDTSKSFNIKPQLLIHSGDFSINSFKWNPKGSKIAFEHQPKPSLDNLFLNDISIYDLKTEEYKILINNESYDALIDWSPDGNSILYETCLNNNTSNFSLNRKLYRVNIDKSDNHELAVGFDEDFEKLLWNEKGIFGLAWQKTNRKLIKINPKSGNTEIMSLERKRIWDYSFSKNNNKLSYTGVNDHNLNEIYITNYPINSNEKQITSSSEQISNWILDKREIIKWSNGSGDSIEGVLHKPENFESDKKYPLLIMIHGGPMFLSYPELTPQYVYPMLQWVNKGAIVLRVNYTGSAGYGEQFRTKNIKKIGTIDAEDILSGIQYLEEKGFVNSDKIGCMGWSHGGFLSATLLTSSNKFKAFSVGAGISNWTTQYVHSDLKQFPKQYLGGTPWATKKFYESRSPISKVNQAITPTLIQHCKFDGRVSISNSYELYEALKSLDIKTKFIVYNVHGHGIYNPKEKLAANLHNWKWFLKHIWNEKVEIE